MKIFDISPNILEAPVYPGDPKPRLEALEKIESGAQYNLSRLEMCCHTGAHIDAPLHYFDDGESVGKLPVSAFCGPCCVREASGPVTAQWVERSLPWNCKRLIIKCAGSGYLMDNAVYEICRFDIKLIGIDSLSVGSPENEGAVHRELLNNGIALLEGIDLSGVPAGDYFLFAAPLNIACAEAAPCRALLIKGITACESE